MTAPAMPARRQPAQAAYLRHIATCERGWCDDCRTLARNADAESGRRHGWED